jgi:hypothetical protein
MSSGTPGTGLRLFKWLTASFHDVADEEANGRFSARSDFVNNLGVCVDGGHKRVLNCLWNKVREIPQLGIRCAVRA